MKAGRVSLSHHLIGLVCLLVWVLVVCVFLGLVVVVVVFLVCLFSHLQDLSVVDSWVYLWPQAIRYKDCHYRHDERSNSPKKIKNSESFRNGGWQLNFHNIWRFNCLTILLLDDSLLDDSITWRLYYLRISLLHDCSNLPIDNFITWRFYYLTILLIDNYLTVTWQSLEDSIIYLKILLIEDSITWLLYYLTIPLRDDSISWRFYSLMLL